MLLSAEDLCRMPRLVGDTVTVRIVSPLRIMEEGRPVRSLSFSTLIRSLMRRISSIAYYYGGCEPELDYPWLAELSRTVTTVASALDWVEWRRNLGGLVGQVTFAGPLGEFLPFLVLGEVFHAGKGAAYGLGEFRLEMPRLPCHGRSEG